MDIEFLKYPIGKPSIEEQPEDARIEGCIAVIGRMPNQLMEFAKSLTEAQWDTLIERAVGPFVRWCTILQIPI